MSPDHVGRFAAVCTGAIADNLDEMGEGPFALPSHLAPLRPCVPTAGLAFPVVGRSATGLDYDRSIRRLLTTLGEVGDGHVVVYETHDEVSTHLGELSAAAVQVRGCGGAVVDGGVRDVRYVLEIGLPVWSHDVTPVDCTRRWQRLEWKPSCRGDVAIALGDVVVGAEDDLVRILAEVADEGSSAVSGSSTQRTPCGRECRSPTPYDRFGKL